MKSVQSKFAGFCRFNFITGTILLLVSSPNAVAKLAENDPVESGVKKYESGDFAGALKDFNAAIANNSKDLEALDNRAMLYFQLGAKEKAFADLDRAIKFNPHDEFSYSKRGEFKRLTGDFAGSLADYQRAVSINPNSDVALIGKARTEIELASYKNAEVDLKRAKALSPTDFQIQYLLISFSSKQLKDQKSAKLLYAHMLEMRAKSADDHFWLGSAHCVFNESKLAEQEFANSIKLDPHFYQAYFNRAVVKNGTGDKPGALLDLNQAIDLCKGDAKAYFNRSILRKELGDSAGADADFQRALELDPNIKKNNTRMLNRFIVILRSRFVIEFYC